MGFVDVKYKHGQNERGSDITFSDMDKFGLRRNYGVQVKAGNLSGEANSDIDKIIGQIDDALSMEYFDTSSREIRNTSILIVAISGKFTYGAKEKIRQKVNRLNVHFFDLDKIKELLAAHTRIIINQVHGKELQTNGAGTKLA